MLRSHPETGPKDLDLKIIETFGNEIECKVDYIVINETLSEIFATEAAIQHFLLDHSKLPYI